MQILLIKIDSETSQLEAIKSKKDLFKDFAVWIIHNYTGLISEVDSLPA